MNRLGKEKSSYLLRHASNPVDWYPWGEEAFEAARERKCPVFLSVGYATCHWCRVMENDAFSDPEVALLLNKSFVCIKVDREERPEVDAVYMECAQALMLSSAGWPLNLFLTTDLKPFFAVTYLPARSGQGLLGFKDLLEKISALWEGDKKQILIAQSDRLIELLQAVPVSAPGEIITLNEISERVDQILTRADPVFGGLKGEPKFPLSYHSLLLLAHSQIFRDGRALFFLEVTLQKMVEGGLFDHLGGGFARYTVDQRWQVPHFEKMLVSNALLCLSYSLSWSCTKTPLYGRVAKEVADYMLRELRLSDGGFCTGEDADYGGLEGAYYLWSFEELENLLTPDRLKVFSQVYGITREGNFHGKNILHMIEPIEDVWENSGLEEEVFRQVLAESKEILLSARAQRGKPEKDCRLITASNAWTVEALLKAGVVFHKEEYIKASEETLLFLKETLWKENSLLHCPQEGGFRLEGSLDDYAVLIKASLSFFEEGKGSCFLAWAVDLADRAEELFKSPSGAFYRTQEKDALFFRKCDFFDGAEPSGNGVHAENLVRLYTITGQERFLAQAKALFRAARRHIDEEPVESCYLLSALFRMISAKAVTLVIAFDVEQSGRWEIDRALSTLYLPHKTVIRKDYEDAVLNGLAPGIADKNPIEGKTTLYVCYGAECIAPENDLGEILKVIQEL